MFKINDKKQRKRALLKINACKPNCGANGDKDDVYEASNVQKVIEKSVQYNIDDAPNHLVRKTMKFEEVYSQNSSSGIDEVDQAGSSSLSRRSLLNYPSTERNIKSKVASTSSLEIRSRT